jgi:hypothetical protein
VDTAADHRLLPGNVTEWFPLVPRPRPPCRALRHRVAEIRDLARSASNGETGLATAAEAHNKAALIASDCGLPDLARQLCWRQFDIFQAAAPLSKTAAKYALQPIVNLGRLLTRTGHGNRAYQVYLDAFHAVTTASTATIDGRDIDFGPLVNQDRQRQELTKFLWTVLLADGTRALTRSGRWDEALRHLEQNKGIGQRMLDGRQVAILARYVAGNGDQALALLDTSTIPEPWEQAIAAYLRALCLPVTDRLTGTAIAAMINHYRQLDLAAPLVFRTRFGLCVLDLVGDPHNAPAQQLAEVIVREAVQATDAYVASDVLRDPVCRASLTGTDRRKLSETVESSGLRRETMPADLRDDLLESVRCSEVYLKQRLAEQPRTI